MTPPRTYIFYGLNLVRLLSIVSLILVFSSSIFVMVVNIKAVNAFTAAKAGNSTDLEEPSSDMLDCDYIEGSTVPNQPAGVFWAVVSSLLIIFQSVILFLSELGWPASFFDRFFPVLGSDFGLGALGIFQCLIGAQILSHHVDDFTLVSAFFLFSIGCLDMLLGLIFRESAKVKRSIAGYRSQSKGILPTSKDNRPVFVNANPAFVPSMFDPNSPPFIAAEKPQTPTEFGVWRSQSDASNKSGLGFGRQGEKAAGLRGFMLQKPEESLPRYASPSPPPMPQSPPQMPTPSPAPARLARGKSTTSSFASPGVYRQSLRSDLEDCYDDSEEDDDHTSSSRSETPPPAFRSSPTAI